MAAEDEHLVGVEAVGLDQLRANGRVVVALDPAVVGHLAAARGIERRLAQLREERSVAEILEGAELREDVHLRVADELGREPGRLGEVCGTLAEAFLPRPARDLAVALHLHPVAVDVDRVASLACELDGQLDREAVGRGETEGVRRADVGAGELLELLHAAVERLAEPLLLGADDALDLGGVLDDLGVPRPDLLDDDARQRIDRGQADAACLNDRAADEAAQDVAAALVRRRHALRDEEGHAAAVVAEHAVRLGRLRRRPVRHARLLGDPVHDQPKAVGVEDRVDALDEHRAALEAHPGVDVLLRERRERAVRARGRTP